jgi:hypothetical protein
MRLLRLGNSADTHPGTEPADRSMEVCRRLLEADVGEPVELVRKVAWPTPDFPGIVEGWLERYRPDAVFFWVNTYWFTFERAARGLERRVGPLARPIAAAADRAGDVPWLRQSRLLRYPRRLLLRSAPGEVEFEPEAVVRCCEAVIRAVVRREETALLVRGPQMPMVFRAGAAARARGEARRLVVHRALERLTAELHVDYIGVADGLAYLDDAGNWERDGYHPSLEHHRRMGEEEARLIARAVRELRGERVS